MLSNDTCVQPVPTCKSVIGVTPPKIDAKHTTARVNHEGLSGAQEVWEQCEQDAASLGSNPGVVAQLGWAAALQGLPDLAERCASQAAKSQDTGPRAWADLIRAQLQFAKYQAARYLRQHTA